MSGHSSIHAVKYECNKKFESTPKLYFYFLLIRLESVFFAKTVICPHTSLLIFSLSKLGTYKKLKLI